MSVLLDFFRAENDDLERLREILATRVDINEKNADGRTALHLLASKTIRDRQDEDNALEMARLLIMHESDINARTILGLTPLIEAVHANNLRMVELFLERNADFNQPDIEGRTPLHHAVISYNSVNRERNNVGYIRKQIVKTLVKGRCHIDLMDLYHKTPLMWAVENQDYLIAKELLKQNASVNARDRRNNSLMHYALDQELVNEDMVLELVRHGCRFSDENQDNETAMTVYIGKLKSASDDKLKAAKYVFKLFLIVASMFRQRELEDILEIGVEEKGKLAHYCYACHKERSRMSGFKLEKGSNLFEEVKSTVSSRNLGESTITEKDFDKILEKLFQGKFPSYCDFVVSTIRHSYLAKKFSKKCKYVGNTGRRFLSSDVLYLLSSYLSHFDMFNMMVAFTLPVKKYGCLPPISCRK